jgi:hypothetical protein
MATHLQPVGRVPAGQRLSLAIGLPLRDKAGLDAFLKALYDPASPNYHRYLTHEEFTKRFGPTEEDYAEVKAFAQANGLSNTGTYDDRMLLVVSGSAAAVEDAFHIALRTYHHPTENRDFFAPDTEPSVEATLPIADVSGLNNYSRPHPNSHWPKLPGTPTPNAGSGTNGSYIGEDFRNAYVPGTALTGAGQSVGLLQFDGFYTNDIVAYARAAGGGRTNIVVQKVLTDTYQGAPGSGNGEVSLDIEMTMAMAPGLSRIVVFEASPGGGLPDTILAAMVTNTAIKQFSSSWSWGGPDASTENYFLTMAAQGQSFFNASGDFDALLPNGDNTDYPANSPNVTSVGGTVLTMNGSGTSYASEAVWNDNNGPNAVGSTGGLSTNAIPDWQQGLNMSTNKGSTSYRNVPDVALTAKNVYVLFFNGLTGNVSGTSCAAPLWAGYMALVNQQAASLGYESAGFINPAIYAIGKGMGSTPYSSAFHDITVGNNEWTYSPTLFNAVAGYDLCTGWGTPTLNLITALAAPLVPTVFNTNDSGVGSLRYIIAYATNGATITFAPNLSGKTILLTNGQLSVSSNLTVDASALTNGIQINGSHNSRIFNIAGGVSATLDSLTLTNGYAGAGIYGGAIENVGSLTLNRCTLAGNSADPTAVGGAIDNSGALSMTACSVLGNSAGFAGAIQNRGGSSCILENCTFSDNLATSGNGGVIDNVGAMLALTQCTFSSNSAFGAGGAVDNYLSTLNVTNSILANNAAAGGGADIYNWGSSTVTVEGTNLIVGLANNGTLNGSGSIIANAPQLAQLGYYGGSTQTMPPLLGSPAIDAGSDAAATGLATDQRGLPRRLGPHVDIGAVEYQGLPVVTASDSGPGSLRYAATYVPSGGLVTFDPSLSGQTILLTNGQLSVTNNLTIDGSGLPNGLQINAGHNSRIFNVAGGVSLTLNSLTLSNGFAGTGNFGGAIDNSGALSMTACSVLGNSAGSAGAIQNRGGSSCILENCTFSGNLATSGNGGVIDNVGAMLALTQCTFSSNSAVGAGGAVDNYLSTLNVTNSILANNAAAGGGADIYNWGSSTVTIGGTNLVVALANNGTLNGSGSIIAGAPQLAQLGNYGGPTKTMPPLASSPAVDAGSDAAVTGLATDQRGLPRQFGPHVDIGAVEYQGLPVVTTSDSGPGSLRYAVTYVPPGSLVTFDPSLSGQTILLTSGELALNNNLTVDASSLPNGIQINGDQNSRIFDVAEGVTAVLNSLTLTNGFAGTDNFGGAIQNAGLLTLFRCTLEGNSTDTNDLGGAIYNEGALTMTACSLLGNSAAGGGAIYNSATCVLLNCTLAGNAALGGDGGAIGNEFSDNLALTQCTVSENSAGGSGGAVENNHSTFNVTNSILANNAAAFRGADIYNIRGTNTFVGSNIVQSLYSIGGSTNGTPPINANPQLAPLGFYGGSTQTMPPTGISPAIDSGSDVPAVGIATDQRGYPRISGSHVDIGAVEAQLATNHSVIAVGALSNGVFQFSFTNLVGSGFSVVASTNLTFPLNLWSNIGIVLENPVGSGHFQFADPQATTLPQRFYQVRSP